MSRSTQIVSSRYYDSVVLMRVASQLKKRDGVAEAALFMGTEGNHALLAQVGLATAESREAGPDDLIIIVEADSGELAREIVAEAEVMLTDTARDSGDELDYRPRTLERALGFLPGANWAAISVPGEYAAREARRCLERGLNVFLFSDNVSVEDEVALKESALARGLLCMGPDCGTALVGGVALGFANMVRPGRVGCVAASGTGLQAVMCQLDRLGEGVSQAIGVGGRDLSLAVEGRMTVAALRLLDEDPGTEVIILVSKPPHPQIAARIEQLCSSLATPVVACFQGAQEVSGTLLQADTLDRAAALAVSRLRGEPFRPGLFAESAKVRSVLQEVGGDTAFGRVVGLFTGGTLAKEAQLILGEGGEEVSSTEDAAAGHIVVDLGDDAYTVGKPHPMIAPESRTEMLLELAGKGRLASCACLLFDLVLGTGSHEDPALELCRGLDRLREQYGLRPRAVCAVIGTEADPQELEGQVRRLEEAGVIVFRCNSEAARFALMLVASRRRQEYLEEGI